MRFAYPWEVWDSGDDYNKPQPLGKFRDPYDAVRFVSICEDGTTVRVGGKVVYRQAEDGDAAESFDDAIDVIASRVPGWFSVL